MTISTSTCLEEGPQGFFISEDNTVRITHLNIEDEGWEQFLFLFFYPFISVSCFCCLLQTRFKPGCFVLSEQNDKNVLLVILKKMLCFSPFFLKIKWTQKVLLMIENKCFKGKKIRLYIFKFLCCKFSSIGSC